MIHRLADLRIAAKLLLGFSVVCVLLVAVAGVSAVHLRQAQADLQELDTSGLASVQISEQTNSTFQRIRFDVANTALAPDVAGEDAAEQAVTDDDAKLDRLWAAYLRTSPGSTAAQQKAFTDALAAYRAVVVQLEEKARAGDDAGFLDQRARSAAPAAEQVTQALDAITAAESDAAAAIVAQGEAAYRSALAVLAGSVVAALALAAAIAAAVARSVSRPLARVVDVVDGLAQGRLDQRVGLERRDEVGRLAASTDASVGALREVLLAIRGESDALGTSAGTLSGVAAALQTGAEGSSAQALLVSAASEEVSTSIATVAAAGEQMTAAITQIATATSDASAMATAAVAAAGSAGTAIERLGVSSREIGDVVKLITSIAEQTNLLALNATIEAARAGELGKGFAVVAGEVKELARQTAQATDDITAKVSATQSDTAAAAAAVTEIGEVIARIDEVQATIAAAVEEQSATTSEMVRNITEISTGSAQISENIAGIATGSEVNRAGAGTTATAAASLDSAAARLRQLTGRFTL